MQIILKRVERILETVPDTRDSDDLLYYEVCRSIHPEVSTISFSAVMHYRKRLGLPNFETVRRTRQKIQAVREDLRATEQTQEARKKEEKTFREFAIE